MSLIEGMDDIMTHIRNQEVYIKKLETQLKENTMSVRAVLKKSNIDTMDENNVEEYNLEKLINMMAGLMVGYREKALALEKAVEIRQE